MDYVLNVEPRTVTGRHVKRVRAAGFVPAVVYGQGEPALPLQFREIDMVRILRSGGLSQLIELQGLEEPIKVLVKEVQRHPLRRNLLHVDFYRVQMDVKIQTDVPVHMIGESEAIKGGAVLIHHMDNITVECLPSNIPEALIADLSKLKTLSDVITVADLPVPEGVVVMQEPETPVFSVTIPRKLASEQEAAEGAEAVEAEEQAAKGEEL